MHLISSAASKNDFHANSIKHLLQCRMILVVVVELVLYIHGQKLRSCRDGLLSYPHCSWASLPEAGYQYLAPILSPLGACFHEQSLFAKYLHAFVSDFQNKCHFKCFNCLSILRNRYNHMKNRYSRGSRL